MEHRRLTGRVVIATHNPGKVWEINKLIEPYGLAAVPSGELGLATAEVSGETTNDGELPERRCFAGVIKIPLPDFE